MTRQDLRAACAACAAYKLTKPVTLDDCREIFDDLRQSVALGVPLEVVRLDESTVRVTAGEHDSTYSVEIQA